MTTRLRRWWRSLTRDLGLTDGQGMGGDHGSLSWGGCADRATLRGHHCGGHPADSRPWQHTCPCGFKWAS